MKHNPVRVRPAVLLGCALAMSAIAPDVLAQSGAATTPTVANATLVEGTAFVTVRESKS